VGNALKERHDVNVRRVDFSEHYRQFVTKSNPNHKRHQGCCSIDNFASHYESIPGADRASVEDASKTTLAQPGVKVRRGKNLRIFNPV
jgi:hypothetical protein